MSSTTIVLTRRLPLLPPPRGAPCVSLGRACVRAPTRPRGHTCGARSIWISVTHAAAGTVPNDGQQICNNIVGSRRMGGSVIYGATVLATWEAIASPTLT